MQSRGNRHDFATQNTETTIGSSSGQITTTSISNSKPQTQQQPLNYQRVSYLGLMQPFQSNQVHQISSAFRDNKTPKESTRPLKPDEQFESTSKCNMNSFKITEAVNSPPVAQDQTGPLNTARRIGSSAKSPATVIQASKVSAEVQAQQRFEMSGENTARAHNDRAFVEEILKTASSQGQDYFLSEPKYIQKQGVTQPTDNSEIEINKLVETQSSESFEKPSGFSLGQENQEVSPQALDPDSESIESPLKAKKHVHKWADESSDSTARQDCEDDSSPTNLIFNNRKTVFNDISQKQLRDSPELCKHFDGESPVASPGVKIQHSDQAEPDIYQDNNNEDTLALFRQINAITPTKNYMHSDMSPLKSERQQPEMMKSKQCMKSRRDELLGPKNTFSKKKQGSKQQAKQKFVNQAHMNITCSSPRVMPTVNLSTKQIKASSAIAGQSTKGTPRKGQSSKVNGLYFQSQQTQLTKFGQQKKAVGKMGGLTSVRASTNLNISSSNLLSQSKGVNQSFSNLNEVKYSYLKKEPCRNTKMGQSSISKQQTPTNINQQSYVGQLDLSKNVANTSYVSTKNNQLFKVGSKSTAQNQKENKAKRVEAQTELGLSPMGKKQKQGEALRQSMACQNLTAGKKTTVSTKVASANQSTIQRKASHLRKKSELATNMSFQVTDQQQDHDIVDLKTPTTIAAKNLNISTSLNKPRNTSRKRKSKPSVNKAQPMFTNTNSKVKEDRLASFSLKDKVNPALRNSMTVGPTSFTAQNKLAKDQATSQTVLKNTVNQLHNGINTSSVINSKASKPSQLYTASSNLQEKHQNLKSVRQNMKSYTNTGLQKRSASIVKPQNQNCSMLISNTGSNQAQISRKSNPLHLSKLGRLPSNTGGQNTSMSHSHVVLGNNSQRPQKQDKPTAANNWLMLDTEVKQFGDRCPKGFTKNQLLGKGGVAVVWLAIQNDTGAKYALKQFPKHKGSSSLDQSAQTEIEVGKELFQRGEFEDGLALDPKLFPGIKMIAKLHKVIEEGKDLWLAYEVGSQPLTKLLFDVKGEFYKGERIYNIQHMDFYRALRTDKSVMKDLVRRLAQVFDVLAMFRIVHADVKCDNILVDFDSKTGKIKDLKLIDFGSAFSYENPSNITASTPEYLAPEVLEYLEKRGQNTAANGTNSTNLCKKQEPWSYDMWSFGTILLEILTGIPIWMSLKCRAQTQSGKSLIGMGILGVQGRVGKKILQKQAAVLKNLPGTLRKYDTYSLDKDPNFMDLLVRMLDPCPLTRISPLEILEHPFLLQDGDFIDLGDKTDLLSEGNTFGQSEDSALQ